MCAFENELGVYAKLLSFVNFISIDSFLLGIPIIAVRAFLLCGGTLSYISKQCVNCPMAFLKVESCIGFLSGASYFSIVDI